MSNQKNPKIIFITGGVISSLGKGITAASVGLLLRQMNYKVNIKKLDPYLNVDPGTMNPTQHGEVFVTEDGTESDLDLGYYERFAGIKTTVNNSVTSGKIYQTLIERERKGAYLGKTVQTIPHVTDLIKNFILLDVESYDFTICEIGGTVGDIEALPFLEATRQLKNKYKEGVAFVHLTYLPYLKTCNETKTKPTQHSVKELMSIGIVPDILICRSAEEIDESIKSKISLFCNIEPKAAISATDAKNIHEVPLQYYQQNLHSVLMDKLGVTSYSEPDLSEWEKLVEKINSITEEISVLIAGKYSANSDAYKSLVEAISHASTAENVKLKLKYLDSREFDNKELTEEGINLIKSCKCIIVPGGFGTDGSKGKMKILTYTRENNIPTMGICLGMQLMVIEFARQTEELKNSTSEEFESTDLNVTKEFPRINIVKFMELFVKDCDTVELRTKASNLGATMRLGNCTTVLQSGTVARDIYKLDEVIERHRHRYEIDSEHEKILNDSGMIFSGKSKRHNLTEIVEIPSLNFYLGVQFHPELASKPLKPHPLFIALIKAGKSFG